MYKSKLENQLKKFSDYLIVDQGLAEITATGYCRSLSISLRRMRKYVPEEKIVKSHILWMREKNYSYSHIANTSLALEHFFKYKGIQFKISRQRKPRQIVKDILTEAEVSRFITSTKNIREKAIICVLSYSGIRNKEICNLKVEDVDLGANHLRVIGGKNSKDCRIPHTLTGSIPLIWTT